MLHVIYVEPELRNTYITEKQSVYWICKNEWKLVGIEINSKSCVFRKLFPVVLGAEVPSIGKY